MHRSTDAATGATLF